MSGSIVVLPLSFGAGSIAVFVAPSFYEMTMKDSYAVLKTSLLIALVISLVAIFSLSLGAAIVALVFVFSPVLYDFIRDLVFPNVPQEIPWHERKVGVRLLEIVVEAVISSLIGLVVILAVTGHL
jgi:ABC-type phosphate/phosphonate transport system permease subunit